MSGLYAEMVDPSTGEQLGNTPQAFTHMAVVTSCSAISAARRGELPPPDQPFSFVEACLDRRLSADPGLNRARHRMNPPVVPAR